MEGKKIRDNEGREMLIFVGMLGLLKVILGI